MLWHDSFIFVCDKRSSKTFCTCTSSSTDLMTASIDNPSRNIIFDDILDIWYIKSSTSNIGGLDLTRLFAAARSTRPTVSRRGLADGSTRRGCNTKQFLLQSMLTAFVASLLEDTLPLSISSSSVMEALSLSTASF